MTEIDYNALADEIDKRRTPPTTAQPIAQYTVNEAMRVLSESMRALAPAEEVDHQICRFCKHALGAHTPRSGCTYGHGCRCLAHPSEARPR